MMTRLVYCIEAIFLMISINANSSEIKLIPRENDVAFGSAKVLTGQYFAPCMFDGNVRECFLDTGARKSMIKEDDFSRKYPVVSEDAFPSGIGGSLKRYSIIRIGRFSMGDFSRSPYKVYRTSGPVVESGGLIGSDAFMGQCVFFDFKGNSLQICKSIPAGLKKYSLKYFKKTWPVVEVALRDKGSLAVWDTGASVTLVDEEFVEKFPGLFSPVAESDQIRDGAGKTITTKAYRVLDLNIGGVGFLGEYVIATDFTNLRSQVDSNVRFVLGYQILKSHNWYIDYQKEKWAIVR